MNYDQMDGLAQALFEESGDALFLFDPDTDRLLDANSTAQRLTGFALSELLRLPVAQLIRSDGRDKLQRLAQAGRKTGLFHSQEGYCLRTVQDGVWVEVNLTVSRLHVKPKTIGLMTARDVRVQREAQPHPRRGEGEQQRGRGSNAECSWSAEIDSANKFHYRYFEPAIESITGQPPDYFLEGINRWWSIVHPDDQPRWEKAFLRLRAGQPIQEEYRIVRPDGGIRWVRDRVAATRCEQPRSIRLEGILADVTEGKLSQDDSQPRDALA